MGNNGECRVFQTSCRLPQKPHWFTQGLRETGDCERARQATACDQLFSHLRQFQQAFSVGSGSSEGLTRPSSVHNNRCHQRYQNHTSHRPRCGADNILFGTWKCKRETVWVQNNLYRMRKYSNKSSNLLKNSNKFYFSVSCTVNSWRRFSFLGWRRRATSVLYFITYLL